MSMLILQGSDDTFMTDAEKMYSALKRLGRPAELAIYRGGGHYIGEWYLSNAADAVERMMAFYRKHLGEPWRVGKPQAIDLPATARRP